MALRRSIAWLASFCVAALASAQIEPFQMLHSSPAANDNLGVSIDVDRDTMIVGAYNYDPAGKNNAGAAVVFRWAGTSWVEEARLIAADGVAGDQFGRSVAISGNTVVVGSPGHDLPAKGNAGAAYVFQRSGATWTQVAKLTAADSAASDQFGQSIDLDGDTVLVGAPFKNGAISGSQSGAAYIFARTNQIWAQQQKLTDINGSASDNFGNSVALQGNTAVVGSPSDDVVFVDRGSAHVFTRAGTSWTKQATINPGDGATSDAFGSSVAFDSGTISIGAPSHDLTTNGNQGALYVFAGSGATWTQQAKITRPAPAVNDFFPNCVGIQGDTIVAGLQTFDGIVGSNQGAGLFYTRSGTAWSAGQYFQPNETQAGALIGSSIAISDQFVGVGSFSYSKTASGQGAAFAFRRVSGGEPSRALAITPPTPQANANFGNRMASDGTRLVVGAFAEDGSLGADEGAVYIYRVQDESLILEQRIFANDSFAGKKFGYSLAIDGTTLLVGALEDAGSGSGIGSAYVFTFNGSTWSQQAKLVASDGTALDRFGYSVAISGDRAVVGAPYEDIVISAVNQADAGAAYFFTRSGTTWTQSTKASFSGAKFQDYFGWSVAIDADAAYVGGPNYDSTANLTQNRGAIFFYRFSAGSWTYDNTKSDVGNSDGEQFGTALSARSGLFAATAPGSNSVSLYSWDGTNVTVRGTVNQNDASFGNAISVQSDVVIVGMPGYGGGGIAVRYNRSGTTVSSPTFCFPAAIDSSDNVGEAVGYAGGAVFAGGGGITLSGVNNCGAVRRLQSGARYDTFPINTSNSVRYASMASMISGVPSLENDLIAELAPLARSGGFSFGASRATLNVPVAPFMAASQTITLTNGSELSTASSDMRLWNRTSVAAGASATLRAGSLLLDLPSSLEIGAGGSLAVTPTAVTFAGTATVLPGGFLNANVIENRGSLTNFGGVVSTTALNNIAGARISGYGDYAIGVTNVGLFDVDADTQIAGNLDNLAGGTITVFNGTLTVLGTLTNDGAIIGDVQGIRSPNSIAADPLGLYAAPAFGPRGVQSVYAKGGITMDAGARLSPGINSVIKTAGHFDCAITSNLNFDMLQRTLQLTARGPQNLEAMSMDRGPLLDNFNPNLPGSFPIGTLRVGPAQANVTIVDSRDNDLLGQSVCEAVYVDTLIIDAGTTLNVPCGKVYYKTLINNGTILTPLNVVALRGPCPADFNQDGFLTFEDFDAFVGAFEAGDAPADFNGDGFLTFEDFDAFVSAFEAGC